MALIASRLSRVLCAWVLLVAGCSVASRPPAPADSAGRLRLVATTTLVADLVRSVGGERVTVQALMGPGVDPHLYKPSIGDVIRLDEADAVFYNGLHLEGRMADLFENMRRAGKHTYAIASAVPPDALLVKQDGMPDPHIWFDPELWGMAARGVADALSRLDPEGTDIYQRRLVAYLADLAQLDEWTRTELARIPPQARRLVTAHDAFSYFGIRYGLEVRALQGINTAAEVGTRDVQQLASFLAEQRVPAIFVETSVSAATLEAVRQATLAQGWQVQFGDVLFSDALGAPGSAADTHAGMVMHNVNAIVAALSSTPDLAP